MYRIMLNILTMNIQGMFCDQEHTHSVAQVRKW